MSHVDAILSRYKPGIRLRSVQPTAIERLVAGQDTLCLMATGEGKSLIYEVAGLVRGGVTLVVSPLIALMGQQQSNVADMEGIQSVSLGGMESRRAHEALKRFDFNHTGFLFLSPEMAMVDGFLENVLRHHRNSVRLLVLDEVHCVSQWGFSFRPAYAELPVFLHRVFGVGRPPLLALTATIHPRDQEEVLQMFEMPSDCVVRSQSLVRSNIRLLKETLKDEEAKAARLGQILRTHQDEKVIVYVHRKKSDKWGTAAMAARFRADGISSAAFDADLTADERRAVLADFRAGTTRVVFATSAFGMGIDIPDIRAIVHFLMPESVEQYYQEVGRAGRDGKSATAYLLYTETNLRVRRDLIRKSIPTQETIYKHFEDFFRADGGPIRSWDMHHDRDDDDLLGQVWHLLHKRRVVELLAKAPDRIDRFSPRPGAAIDWRRIEQASMTKNPVTVAKKLGMGLDALATTLFDAYREGSLHAAGNLPKRLYFRAPNEVLEDQMQAILAEAEMRGRLRNDGLANLQAIIEGDRPMETGVCEALDLA